MLYEVITHDRDVEGAAAQVEDRYQAVLALVEPVGERRGSRLVDDAQHLEAGDLAGVRITSYNVCYTKLLRFHACAGCM